MKKSLLSMAVASSLFVGAANADFLGAEIGYASWKPELTGELTYKGEGIDLEKDLGFGDKESASYMWVSFEHPVPIIPNARIIQTNLELDASNQLSAEVKFADKTYSASENVETDLTLNQTDYVLYYEFSEGLIIPFVHLDAGIAVKMLDGEIRLKGTSLDEKKDFSAPIPMVYGKVKLSTSAIPFIPVDIEYETLRLSIGDNEVTDNKMGIVYDVELPVGFNIGAVAGIRKETLDIDESGVKAKIDIEGYYFGAYFNW